MELMVGPQKSGIQCHALNSNGVRYLKSCQMPSLMQFACNLLVSSTSWPLPSGKLT